MEFFRLSQNCMQQASWMMIERVKNFRLTDTRTWLPVWTMSTWGRIDARLTGSRIQCRFQFAPKHFDRKSTSKLEVYFGYLKILSFCLSRTVEMELVRFFTNLSRLRMCVYLYFCYLAKTNFEGTVYWALFADRFEVRAHKIFVHLSHQYILLGIDPRWTQLLRNTTALQFTFYGQCRTTLSVGRMLREWESIPSWF